jgi:uncharacterized protein (TIGR03437 family)
VDSSNTSYPVPLYFVAQGQVNYYIPSTVKPGAALVTVKSGDGTQTSGILLISPVMPGIYTANANGQGPPAAIAVCSGTCAGWPNHQGQFWQYTFNNGCSGDCVPEPISVAAGDEVVLELFGTGLRHRSAVTAVTAQINNQSFPVQYADKSGYTGEDQINVMLPSSLAGSGQVNLGLTVQDTVDGLTFTSNTVTLNFK